MYFVVSKDHSVCATERTQAHSRGIIGFLYFQYPDAAMTYPLSPLNTDTLRPQAHKHIEHDVLQQLPIKKDAS